MTDKARYIVNSGPKVPVAGLKAAVTTDSAIVTETMMKVLNGGGNAADAVIAGAMVQAAVEPFMTNHAGLVTMLYYEAKTGIVHQLDSIGCHPSGLPPFKPVPSGMGPYAALAPSAIIPGFMPGLKAIHAKFGTKRWPELCEDAVRWAERGHPVSTFEYGMNVFAEKFITYFPEGRDFYQPGGFFPNVGDIFTPPGMAETLRGVRDDGPDYMITGPWAEAFVAKGNEVGWNVRMDHMTETPPRWVEPLRFPYHEYELVFLGPPQAQGFYTAVALGVLKHLGIRDMEPGSSEHLWAMGHALRQGERHWEYAHDDQFFDVPREAVLDDAYHAHLAKLVRGSRPKVDLSDHIRLSGDSASSGDDYLSKFGGSGGKPRLATQDRKQPTGSCEIAVVDAEGNWCQFMDTLQASGIPGQVVGGIPMVGSHTTFGHLHSSMDAVLVKGAKQRSVIGNTLVLKDGRPVFSAGSPGNIHCTLPQVLAYLLDFKLDPYSAVAAPRMLPMSETRTVIIEDRLRDGVVAELHKLGLRVGVLNAFDWHMGSFAVIARDQADDTLTAVADPRRCGVADGIRT
ncbi:gamma-glutamyltransferase [Sphingosinicella sp. CPCC 101087]|uniref:gamma-glutamyltransferase n=1 Tax=Sphingosinicella sp. CPCC 101087 TaxID=2497754 RepID=UPI0013ECFE11|nr:gamma-glutamyltransferase [Sphingosinicella sp. CPCC 101087]